MRQFFVSHDLSGKPFADAPHLMQDNRFRVVVQTEAALSFLDRRAAKPEQPWFLYLAFNAVHTPMHATDDRLAKFPNVADQQRRTYDAMMLAMDDAIGKVRAKLAETGQTENTLIKIGRAHV